VGGVLFCPSVLLCSQTERSQTHHVQNTHFPLQVLATLGRAQECLSLGRGGAGAFPACGT